MGAKVVNIGFGHLENGIPLFMSDSTLDKIRTRAKKGSVKDSNEAKKLLKGLEKCRKEWDSWDNEAKIAYVERYVNGNLKPSKLFSATFWLVATPIFTLFLLGCFVFVWLAPITASIALIGSSFFNNGPSLEPDKN